MSAPEDLKRIMWLMLLEWATTSAASARARLISTMSKRSIDAATAPREVGDLQAEIEIFGRLISTVAGPK